jgi:hypothetical protein
MKLDFRIADDKRLVMYMTDDGAAELARELLDAVAKRRAMLSFDGARVDTTFPSPSVVQINFVRPSNGQ